MRVIPLITGCSIILIMRFSQTQISPNISQSFKTAMQTHLADSVSQNLLSHGNLTTNHFILNNKFEKQQESSVHWIITNFSEYGLLYAIKGYYDDRPLLDNGPVIQVIAVCDSKTRKYIVENGLFARFWIYFNASSITRME